MCFDREAEHAILLADDMEEEEEEEVVDDDQDGVDGWTHMEEPTFESVAIYKYNLLAVHGPLSAWPRKLKASSCWKIWLVEVPTWASWISWESKHKQLKPPPNNGYLIQPLLKLAFIRSYWWTSGGLESPPKIKVCLVLATTRVWFGFPWFTELRAANSHAWTTSV